MNSTALAPASQPVKVDIGICTYRRPAVVATLLSLFELTVPKDVNVRLIVADNDAEPSAKASIDRLRETSPFEITYVHCPKSNISIARNACLSTTDADYLVFIDDDETAPREWLVELLKTADETGAEAVLGPVTAVYKPTVPDWMRKGDFHSTLPVWVNGKIITGYTCNTLLRMKAPSVAGRRFALSLGQSGGEDTHFFSHMHAEGGRIAFAEKALLSEPVPDTRASFMWLAKRRFRSGQTHGRLLAEKKPGIRRVVQVVIAAAKIIACAGMAALSAFDPVRRNKQLLRVALHMGSLSGAFGVREIRQYGAVEAT
ncbi:glycosyltransferase [Agrobacterium rubi]|uniref:Glycosyltransferase family 2 protein n=2 Tax=Agrobacterium rubi TaxID=28099 RepID=A0AAE7USQ0_9HYPH|nr:glycosyltransferase family 2 protein [Agrobacterium rubi]MBP1878794.1 succinoglycan biosynthesis protein ExoM [Agrobacterium rubi]MCL6652847.1 glycosyl transferase family A [Agrobacterium rubi]NTE88585.1 glycosyltransferase family 2 protein [Agrobacterium rubi]NTF04413.1 glycosyltransferase family 2 protein [Agrobacterium rubi]NTF09946.1 glycosyltransferase family 2 protein [Agrobacterium rubi]